MPITSLDAVLEDFHRAYLRRKADRQFPTQLPLEWKGYQISEVHTDKLFIVLSHPVLLALGARKHETFQKSQHDRMPDDIDEIVNYFQLGEVVRIWETRLDEVLRNALRWATELADEHIDNPRPSFMQAMTRMGRTYSKLFELEQTLRLFVEGELRARYQDGWWDKVHPGVKVQVEKRERTPTICWFDDYTPSRLQFADFDGLRLTVLANWVDFKDAVGDRELFHSNMVYLSRARDRIAHVNTLSGNDCQEFVTQAGRMLDIVKPHVQHQ